MGSSPTEPKFLKIYFAYGREPPSKAWSKVQASRAEPRSKLACVEKSVRRQNDVFDANANGGV